MSEEEKCKQYYKNLSIQFSFFLKKKDNEFF